MQEIRFDIKVDSNKQIESLIDTITYAVENSNFYNKHLDSFKKQLKSANFSIDDYHKMPFTSKEDLASNNDDFLCVPHNKIAEYVTTSGTTGSPISLFLTKHDLERLAQNECDSLTLMGNTENDLFQLMTTIDKQFMAGLAYYLGVQKLGAGLIRIGPGVPQLQWNSILKYAPSKIIAVPSFILTLLDYAKENNIDVTKSSVKAIVCIGEPIRNDDLSLNTLGKRIKKNWDIELYSTYASTEMGAAFSECSFQAGCHLNEKLLFLEVLKEDGNEAKDGESGEVIITTLNVEGTPLIRYKTGDIARVYRTKCECGIDTPRLGPIIGRKNQMIKYKGTTLFPKAIFEVLESFEDLTCYKVLIDKDDLHNDLITIILDKKIEANSIFEEIRELCRARLRVIPNFKFMETRELNALVYKKHLRKPEKIIFNF